MIRRIEATALAVALIGAFVATGTSLAGAAKPVVTASGTVSCGAPASGKGTVSPPFKLTPGVGARTTKSTLNLKCTGTTTNALVTPISAKVVTKSVSPTSATTCTNLQSASESKTITTTDITWKASGGKINPTHIVFSTSQTGVPALGSTAPGPTGISTITGSYARDATVWKVVASDSLQTLTSACLGKGIKKLNFGAASSLQINEPGIPATGLYSAATFDPNGSASTSGSSTRLPSTPRAPRFRCCSTSTHPRRTPRAPDPRSC